VVQTLWTAGDAPSRWVGLGAISFAALFVVPGMLHDRTPGPFIAKVIVQAFIIIVFASLVAGLIQTFMLLCAFLLHALVLLFGGQSEAGHTISAAAVMCSGVCYRFVEHSVALPIVNMCKRLVGHS
jgi:hypothetical protein